MQKKIVKKLIKKLIKKIYKKNYFLKKCIQIDLDNFEF